MKKRKKVQYSGRLKAYMQWPLVMIAFLVIMDTVITLVNGKAGLIAVCFSAVYGIIMLVMLLHYKPSIMNEMISFATQYGQIQKTLLNEFTIPYALLDDEGKVIWMNEEFCRVVGKDRQYHKSIGGLFPEISAGMLMRMGMEVDIQVHFGDRDYDARLQRVSIESMTKSISLVKVPENREYMIAMYLFDNTELTKFKRENDEQKMVAGLIYLDNYDEALDSVEEVRRSLLVALIDRKINKYISAYDGVVKKLEKDKYFMVIKNQYLNELKANRFSLLEEVKAVNIGNEMSVTLSIGIGVGGSGYLQNCEFSRVAIELALGRGGDQAVVKDGDKISYYGGKSQQMEKSTRVKARVKAHALREFIGNADRVLVMGHKMPDIDCFGSAVGIYRAAQMMNKKAHIVIGDINGSIRPWINLFLDSREYDEDMFLKHEKAIELTDAHTVVVVVDTNKPSMCECPELLTLTKTVVVMDHHRQSSEVIPNAVLSYIEPYASSACEMVAEILQYFSDDVRLKSIEADSIYAGMIVDTNNFLTKTGVRTFEAAAFLRRCGADVTRVRKMLRDDMNSYKAKAEAVRHAEIYMDCYAISRCPAAEHLETPTVVGAQAANELLNIIGVKASFVLTPYQGKIYFSARSIDEVNVQIIMERMGGGGHLNIAGAQIPGISVEEGIRRLKDILTKMTEEGAI